MSNLYLKTLLSTILFAFNEGTGNLVTLWIVLTAAAAPWPPNLHKILILPTKLPRLAIDGCNHYMLSVTSVNTLHANRSTEWLALIGTGGFASGNDNYV
jgi:hypothetical protein